jgi:hypothetical protein
VERNRRWAGERVGLALTALGNANRRSSYGELGIDDHEGII